MRKFHVIFCLDSYMNEKVNVSLSFFNNAMVPCSELYVYIYMQFDLFFIIALDSARSNTVLVLWSVWREDM